MADGGQRNPNQLSRPVLEGEVQGALPGEVELWITRPVKCVVRSVTDQLARKTLDHRELPGSIIPKGSGCYNCRFSLWE